MSSAERDDAAGAAVEILFIGALGILMVVIFAGFLWNTLIVH